MFFATEISSPFGNLEESVFAYPEWKLMIRKSEAGLWYAYATQGEKEKYIQEYWSRIQSSPGETIYDSLSQGLDLIENNSVAIYVSEKELRHYNRYIPIHLKFKTVRGFGFSHQEFFVATKNSPLTSILHIW